MKQEYIKAIDYFLNNPNVSISSVAKMFKIDRGNFGNTLKKMNLSEDRRRKYFCNFSYFENIDCEEKAYWIGFITADGCIKKNNIFSLTLKQEDNYILQELNKSLKSTYSIHNEKINTNYKKNAECCSLKIQDKVFCDNLKQYGIIENKTFKTVFNFNNKIPNIYLNAYIRGIFDGDGWFTDSRHTKGKSKEIGFCGSEQLCLGIKNYLLETLNINSSVTPYKNIYRLRYCNTNAIIKLYRFMYKDATCFLKRKYDKLKDFADSNETIK